MSNRYYITPYDPALWKDENAQGATSDLIIKFMDFSQKAKSKWASFQSYPPFSWTIFSGEKSEVMGSFRGEGQQILALSQPFEAKYFAEFIVWYRQYTPSNYELFLFAEGSWDSLKLTSETTEADIIQFTGLS